MSESTAIRVGHTTLRLRGRDVLDVLQRISSQQLETLRPGEARTTLFCDYRGRVLHRAVVARTADDAVWLLRDDSPATELAVHLDRNVFREDVKIEDLSTRWITRAETCDTDLTTIEEHEGVPVVAPEGRGFRLRLSTAGSMPPLDVTRFERERIARGRPRHGHEVHQDFNPYEIGCGDEVHLSKGCYTGQEALQRLITYASVRRQPVLVHGRGTTPATPADLVSPAGSAGRLTSAVAGEVDGTWLGIAIVRREAVVAVTASTTPSLSIAGGPEIGSFQPLAERRPLGRD